MEEASGPVLVFYHFKHSLERIKKTFPQAVELRDSAISDWNKGRIPLLLAHPQSGGIGLNLQCNTGETAQTVWFDLPWSSEKLHPGQRKNLPPRPGEAGYYTPPRRV